MKAVLNNPYRLVGLLVGATAREQERQVKRLKQFIDADKEPESDFSFPALGKFKRTIESVNDAASKLNLDSDRMYAALFWFYNGNIITDEPALDYLIEDKQQNAIEIWTKIIAKGEINQGNCSAFFNLSTLLLCNAFKRSKINIKLLDKGINLKLKFLESDYIKDFKALATDETYKTTKKELQLLFINQILLELDKNGGITSDKILKILYNQEFCAKKTILNELAEKLIEQIEKKIEETNIKRRTNTINSVNVGKDLFKQTSEILLQLESILGITNIKFSSTSDKVCDEILQCGIDYFNRFKDTVTDNGKFAMELFSIAKTLAIGNIVKQRCQQNIENLQNWIADKQEKENQQRLTNDLDQLKSILDDYNKQLNTIANAEELLSKALPYLVNIRSLLGIKNDLYIGLSTRIAADAQGKCISEINILQERLRNTSVIYYKRKTTILLKERVNAALLAFSKICKMDLRQEFQNHFLENGKSLVDLMNQLDKVDTEPQGVGCFIATMVYGGYNHPQVIILRHFRDDVLVKSFLGNLFIKNYYHYSPKLVKRLENNKVMNFIIRSILDLLIKLLNTK